MGIAYIYIDIVVWLEFFFFFFAVWLAGKKVELGMWFVHVVKAVRRFEFGFIVL